MEIAPRVENGTVRGDWLVFTAVTRPDRVKWPSDGLQSLSALTDKELVKLLWQARSAQHAQGVG